MGKLERKRAKQLVAQGKKLLKRVRRDVNVATLAALEIALLYARAPRK